jgi:hypothetical protein
MHPSSHDRTDAGGASCSTVRDLLPLFSDGEIDPIRARLVRGHLEACESCSEERRSLDEERLWLVEAMVKSPPLSSRFRGKVIARILERRRAERSRKRRTLIVRGSGVAAAAALLVALGIALRGGADVDSPLIARNDGVSGMARVVSSTAEPPAIRPAAPEAASRPAPAARPPSVDRSTAPAVHEPQAGESEATFVSARPPSFGDVLGLVQQIGPTATTSVHHPGEPCPPDPNKDGKVDLIDVAYSCQIIMGAPAPHSLGEAALVPADPDCDEDCLRV